MPRRQRRRGKRPRGEQRGHRLRVSLLFVVGAAAGLIMAGYGEELLRRILPTRRSPSASGEIAGAKEDMMPRAWTDKQERQYEHVKDSAKDRGASAGRAKEIAARTVNKNRAQAGQSRTASKSSVNDISPQRRGGLRSGRGGPKGPTKAQLYNEAKQRNIKGRSTMTKQELAKALGK